MKLVHIVGFIAKKKFVTMHGHMNVEILFCVYTKLFRHIPPQVETVEEKQAYDLNNYLNTRSVPMVGHHSSESLYSV